MGSLAWPLAAPAQSAASVPAAAQSHGDDPIVSELIKNISTPIDPGLTRAAMTPVAGQHTGTLPTSLQSGVPQHQNQPMNMSPVVGAKNGRARGISNAIVGATNAIGNVVAAEGQVKQDHIKDGATKVIMAQQGIDEATQAHQQALANNDAAAASAAQELIQKNTQARDAVFADPKMRKALAKGFDISYTDPQSNKTEEHAAVQAAMKQAKTLQEKKQIMQEQQAKQNAAAGQAAGAAYAKAQPQGMAPNTQAQAQLAMAQQQKALQQTALKDYLTYKSSVMRANATVDAAKIREQGALMMQQSALASKQELQNQRFAQAQALLKDKFSQESKLVWQRAAATRETAMDIYRDKESDPLTVYNKTRTAAEAYSKSSISNIKTLNDLQKQRDGFFMDSKGKPLDAKTVAASKYEIDNLDKQIAIVHDQVQLDKDNAQNFMSQASKMKETFGFGEEDDNGRANSPSSGSSDSSDDSAGFDFSNPHSFLTE